MVSGPISVTRINSDTPIERPLEFNVTMEIPIEVWPSKVLGDFKVDEVRDLMEKYMNSDSWCDGRYAYHEELQMDGVQRELKRALSSAIEDIMERHYGRELQEVGRQMTHGSVGGIIPGRTATRRKRFVRGRQTLTHGPATTTGENHGGGSDTTWNSGYASLCP